MLNNYKTLRCKMSFKVHFLESHLDFFHSNLGDVSDEHGERFHLDICVIENRYKGKWYVSMLADYCWSIKRDDSKTQHKQRRHYLMNELVKMCLVSRLNQITSTVYYINGKLLISRKPPIK